MDYTFGSRTVVSEAPSDGHSKRWGVQCSCGHVLIKTTHDVLKGYRCRACSVYPIKHGHQRTGARSRTYRIWGAMIQRTTNLKNKHYAYYGARGITIEDDDGSGLNNFLMTWASALTA
jgi:hypothetical protein